MARSPARTARLPRRVAACVAAAWALRAAAAAAQPVAPAPPPPVCTCEPERREIGELREARQACEAQRSAASARAERAEADLQSSRRGAEELASARAACQSARELVCAASSATVTAVLQLRPELPANEPCVPSQDRQSLGDVILAWRNARGALQRMESFARGDTDAPAAAVSTRGEVDALAQRLAGGGREPPLVYRRLMVEAVRAIAPRFWRALHAGGREASDAWFTASAELDGALVAEAQAALSAEPGGEVGTAHTTALRLVRSYQLVAGCGARPASRECRRASRLQTFLESSTALAVRQRVREVWSSRCEAAAAPSIMEWLREFPSPQLAVGSAEWSEVTRAAYDKLVSCYLASPDAGASHFPDWLARRLPSPAQLTRRSLEPLDALRAQWEPDGAEAACLRAAHALRALPPPRACALPEVTRADLGGWYERRRALEPGTGTLSLRACDAYVDALWRGRSAEVLDAFPGAPSADELVRVGRDDGPPGPQALRAQCAERVGPAHAFPHDLARIARLAAAAGEDVTASPFRADPATARPIEAVGFEAALRLDAWARGAFTGATPCATLGLSAARCAVCAAAPPGSRYDCSLLASLEDRWRLWRRLVLFGLAALAAVALVLPWALATARAWRAFGAWRRELASHLRGLGLAVARDPLRFVLPSRMSVVRLALPGGPWARWGRSMAVVRAESLGQITERDVRAAAQAARAVEGELAVVTHEEGAPASLAAVRAILDWAARGPRGAVQVLPVSTERLRWARSAEDLLDLVEQVSLRGNPFEVRGRLVSSSQFFNRERLVSGLLAGAQAGAWTVITGLRRFGKSSLSLEVARRLHAPYAYVDLAGFHHELTSGTDPARSVDAILRYVCRQLHASAQALYGPRAALPPPPPDGAVLGADALTAWLHAFLAACRGVDQGRQLTPLVIFDEVEQAIGVGAERVTAAVDALSILVGRLRACLSDGLAARGGDRVGVLFCSAIHVALWAPLSTLGRQSLMGAFSSVSVPRLPDEAAFAMMRGLGARQGIRFTDQALGLIVREAQGIPILVRRIGSSVLELYDPERARQGSLGAVEIGAEGATAAVRREEEDGAPLRVWVESEIGDPHSPVGALLRTLARRGTVTVEELKAQAAETAAAQFEELGLARVLGPEEARRRAQEIAGYVVRMFSEIGILIPEGDVTNPRAFTFPDSIVRRILAAEGGRSLLGF